MSHHSPAAVVDAVLVFLAEVQVASVVSRDLKEKSVTKINEKAKEKHSSPTTIVASTAHHHQQYQYQYQRREQHTTHPLNHP
jgi:hypothetical protein